jgi:DNA repair photolyase
MSLQGPHGRGSHLEPANRFSLRTIERDIDQMTPEDIAAWSRRKTQYITERAGSIISENHSPDIPFRFSLNPYRGCEHGCSYCYARATHEYFGLNAGLDFESIIFVKENAPDLLREWLGRPAYSPESITLSGVTDPYQPIERAYRLTRGCLEVALEAHQPISLITKNALVLRDMDLLEKLAAQNLVHVTLAVTTLDAGLARTMEPRTSTPAARLEAVRELSQANVPVQVLLAPVIPGLNDSEIPAILAAGKEAGASAAGYVLLRLPGTVEAVFLEWLAREQPLRRDRIEARIRATREGKLSDSQFGKRMRGRGEMATQINQLFKLFARKHCLDCGLPKQDDSRFRPPRPCSGQLWLF